MLSAGMDLERPEIRVLGSLLEKQRTTPDTYPLTLNALRLATNQSTNRDPVVAYDERVARRPASPGAARVRAAGERPGRAPKFRHLLAEALPMDGAEQAVMCVLMLRGPQTPGELKQRASACTSSRARRGRRDAPQLIGRGLVRRLERRPGHKEERYVQLLGEGDGARGRRRKCGDALRGALHCGLPAAPKAGPLMDGLEERLVQAGA